MKASSDVLLYSCHSYCGHYRAFSLERKHFWALTEMTEDSVGKTVSKRYSKYIEIAVMVA